MKRILMVLTVVLVMAAMLVVMATPAFASVEGSFQVGCNMAYEHHTPDRMVPPPCGPSG